MKADLVKYEFRKTARQESNESKNVGVWDEFGRFFAIYGAKSNMPLSSGKELRSVRIFNIFGEPLQSITQIPDL